MKCCQKVVGDPGSQPRNAICRGRRYKKEIGGLRDEDVIKGAFEIAARVRTFEKVHVYLVAGQCPESQRRYELRCAFRHEDRYVCSTILQAAHDLCRLVARN